jgi:type II secretory pathway pseudopilin PulG
MSQRSRRGFTLFQLLVIVAVLIILFALFLPAILKAKISAEQRIKAMNNLRQQCLALHDYASANKGLMLPPGRDDNDFSTSAHLLPYLEQEDLFKKIDWKKSIDDKANAQTRKTQVKTFLSPRDPITTVKEEYGGTNFLYNDLVFFLNSKTAIPNGFPDGTSNTIALAETLKGDGGTKAVTVERQHVALKKENLKGLKDDVGKGPWEANDSIVGDRCASWMDGRFLQGTFNGRLRPNDERPDVSCEGVGGLSAIRSLDNIILVGMADGSARPVSTAVSHVTWKAALTPNGGEVLGSDF